MKQKEFQKWKESQGIFPIHFLNVQSYISFFVVQILELARFGNKNLLSLSSKYLDNM